MFGKKKKRTIVQNPIHPVLGEMKHLGVTWELTEKIELELWSEIYKMPLWFYARTEEAGITEEQEIAFEKLKNVMIEKKHELEAAIIGYAQTDDEEILRSRFIPHYIYFSRKGECALFVEDTDEDGAYNDDTETAFALFLLPKVLLIPSEDALDFLHGGGGGVGDDLYGK